MEKDEHLYQYVLGKIALKQEGSSWDFKRQWYSDGQEGKLLHDLICMSNLVEHTDGYLIIGVDEENDYSICGIENDLNRKNTQNLVDFLKSKKFFSGIRPIVYVRTLQIENHLIDIIVIRNSSDTPFYLTEDYKQVRKYHIYTRIQDTNTDIDQSADPNIVEKLWKKRFGIDLTALQRVFVFLKHPDDWEDIDDEMGYFYKFAPEFTITRELLPETGYEYYHCTQTDPIPAWYNIIIRYHQTTICSFEGISLDGGRYFTIVPYFDLLDVSSPPIKLSYYVKNDDSFVLFRFFTQKSLSKNDRFAQRKLLDIVPIFSSKEEKRQFWKYAEKHFWSKRNELDCHSLPPFVEYINNKQNLEIIKNEYLDAMACVYLLAKFRQHNNRST